jgi:hypothetical protein
VSAIPRAVTKRRPRSPLYANQQKMAEILNPARNETLPCTPRLYGCDRALESTCVMLLTVTYIYLFIYATTLTQHNYHYR